MTFNRAYTTTVVLITKKMNLNFKKYAKKLQKPKLTLRRVSSFKKKIKSRGSLHDSFIKLKIQTNKLTITVFHVCSLDVSKTYQTLAYLMALWMKLITADAG